MSFVADNSKGLRVAGMRFWIDAILGAVWAVLAIVTAVWHDWIEIVFRVDPDRGNGGLEWIVVAVFGLAALASFVRANVQWRLTRRRLALDHGQARLT